MFYTEWGFVDASRTEDDAGWEREREREESGIEFLSNLHYNSIQKWAHRGCDTCELNDGITERGDGDAAAADEEVEVVEWRPEKNRSMCMIILNKV